MRTDSIKNISFQHPVPVHRLGLSEAGTLTGWPRARICLLSSWAWADGGPSLCRLRAGLDPLDWLIGIVGAVGFRLLIYFKAKRPKVQAG